MSLMNQAASFLASQRRKYLAERITYSPLSGEALSLFATLGKTLFRSENEYGITIRTFSFDFIVEAGDLGREPQRGDVIISGGKQYEVLAPNNEPCWRWSGNDGNTYRIHTKCLGDADHE